MSLILATDVHLSEKSLMTKVVISSHLKIVPSTKLFRMALRIFSRHWRIFDINGYSCKKQEPMTFDIDLNPASLKTLY